MRMKKHLVILNIGLLGVAILSTTIFLIVDSEKSGERHRAYDSTNSDKNVTHVTATSLITDTYAMNNATADSTINTDEVPLATIPLASVNQTRSRCQTLSFSNVSYLRSSDIIWSIVDGDVDNDGLLDLLVTNMQNNSITIFYGIGDGTFIDHQTLDTADNPSFLRVTDLDNDQYLDVIVSYFNNGSINIFRGLGNRTFATPVSYYAGSRPYMFALADINHDGIIDIIVPASASNSIGILLGDGNGMFQATKFLLIGSFPVLISVIDLNNDQNLDIAVTNYDIHTVSVRLGYGNSTFRSRISYPTMSDPWGIASGDFNSDGYIDLVTSECSDNGSFSILINQRNGTFRPYIGRHLNQCSYWISAVDIDGDSNLDLIILLSTDPYMNIFLGYGDGNFGEALWFSTGSMPFQIVINDFNHDGRSDLAVGNGDGTVSILMNNCTLMT